LKQPHRNAGFKTQEDFRKAEDLSLLFYIAALLALPLAGFLIAQAFV